MKDRADWQESGNTPMTRKQITAEKARELLDYDPETGVLTWKRHMSTRARKGKEAGVIQMGRYRRVGIYGKYYMAHRLAWLIMTGAWPKDEIDHINGDCAYNAWANLREATNTQNNWNTLHKNRSGLEGAAYHSGKGQYRATIRCMGETHFLGWFDSPERAHEAYKRAASRLHGEFARWE